MSMCPSLLQVHRQNGQVPVLGELKSREIGRNRGREREKERRGKQGLERKKNMKKEEEEKKRMRRIDIVTKNNECYEEN